jgi:hypothetical protein
VELLVGTLPAASAWADAGADASTDKAAHPMAANRQPDTAVGLSIASPHRDVLQP